MTETWNFEEREQRVGRIRFENAIEDRSDQAYHEALRCADQRHENYRKQERSEIGPNGAEQASHLGCGAKIVGFRKGMVSIASTTFDTWMELMPWWEVITAEAVCQGPQMPGSDAPNSTTTGRSNAAARWAGPLSFPTKSAAPANRDFTSSSGAPPTHVYRSNATRLSPRPAIKTGSSPRLRWICSATARKL